MISTRYKFGFIVEGTNDEYRLRGAIGGKFPIVILHGNGLSKATEKKISELIENCDNLFIATDPDEAGNTIAKKIQGKFDLPRIELDPEQCYTYRNGLRKKKIGLEHASLEYLLEVLGKAFSEKGLKLYE
jgi:ribonuclease M5